MSLPPSYFADLYATYNDPWGFRDRPYEERKRALTLASLTRPRYASIFEPGCSIGVLTAGLAARTDRLLAIDPAEAAIDEARDAVSDPRVELAVGAVPDDWPLGRWELIVLSELGYYLSGSDLQRLAVLATANADELIAVHWRHPVDDYPLSGDEVQDALASAATGAGLHDVVSHGEEDFRLDVWCRDGRSVARRSGLV